MWYVICLFVLVFVCLEHLRESDDLSPLEFGKAFHLTQQETEGLRSTFLDKHHGDIKILLGTLTLCIEMSSGAVCWNLHAMEATCWGTTHWNSYCSKPDKVCKVWLKQPGPKVKHPLVQCASLLIFLHLWMGWWWCRVWWYKEQW